MVRVVEFRCRNFLGPNAIQFIQKFGHGATGDVSAHIAARAPRSRVLQRGETAVDAIGVAFIFAQIQEQAALRTGAKNLIENNHRREIIRIAAIDGDISHGDGGLYGTRAIDEENLSLPPRRRTPCVRFSRVGLVPICEPLLSWGPGSCVDIARNREDCILRGVVFVAPACEVGRSHCVE